jgi:DNA-binding SARP family transcriptional activator/predicted ATPase
MARLAAHLLGPLQVSLDGKPVAGFESDKARALLAYLVTEAERPHRREKLAGLLWPDRPERVARANLRRVLVNIRQVIGDRHTAPPFLAITPQTIQLDATDELWSDVAAFSNFRQADLGADSPLTQQAIGQIEEVVVLYRGDFLEGFSLRANVAFEEWVLVNRERYRRLAMQAIWRLVEHYGQCGDRGRALKYAWRRLELDPWQEEAHVHVMRLLALDGQRGAALAQYETCRRQLVEELGVGPSEQTTRMYQRIRDGEYPRARERGKTPRAVASRPRHNLPVPLVPLIGRQVELDAIGRCLGDPACRLLTLVGPGGIGKTHLALEAAASQVDNFAHGVYLVSLSPLASADDIVPAVAQAIDLTFRQGEESRRQLFDYLSGRQVLLLLDGFEHLLGYNVSYGQNRRAPKEPGQGNATRLATEILQAAPDVKILVTSRARLDVQGEHVMSIDGLDLPSRRARSAAVDCSAVQLFLSAARRIRPGLEPTPADLIDVARICRLVGGVPLGILLAAPWVETLTPAEIADEISRGLDFLESGRGDVLAAGALGGERQRSLRAVFEHSWGLLSAREQEALKKLSVFCSDFSYEAARQVAGVTLQELKALTDTSMVQRRHAARYAIHELVRYYAAERFAQTPDLEEAVRDGHCAYYAMLLQGYRRHLRSPRRKTVLAEIGWVYGNARAAWDWAVKRRQGERLGQAVDALGDFLEWHGRYAEGETACRAAAVALEAAKAGPEVQVRARVLAWESLFAEKQGHLNTAERAARQSLAALDDRSLAGLDARQEQAFALRQAARSALHTDLGHSRRLGEQSLHLYRELGDQWGMANVLDELGWMASLSGDYGAARCFFEESLKLHQRLGDQRGIASSLGALGYTLFHDGQVDQAERLVRESIASRSEMADWAGATEELFTLGLTLVWLGKLAEADSLLEESVASYQAIGGLAEVARLYAVLAQIKALQGSYERARALARTCLSMAQESGSWREIGISCWVLGGVATAEQAYAQAQSWLQEGVAVLKRVGMPDVLNAALATSGYAAWGAGQPLQAKEYLAQALCNARQTQSLGALLFVLPGVALLMVSRGEIERAVELYALASRHPLVTNARWFADIAGRFIADAAAELPSNVVSAARARALALSLDGAMAGVMAELDEQDEHVCRDGVE